MQNIKCPQSPLGRPETRARHKALSTTSKYATAFYEPFTGERRKIGQNFRYLLPDFSIALAPPPEIFAFFSKKFSDFRFPFKVAKW